VFGKKRELVVGRLHSYEALFAGFFVEYAVAGSVFVGAHGFHRFV